MSPSFVLPAVLACRERCRHVAKTARRLGDEVAGYQPLESSIKDFLDLADRLAARPLEPQEAVVRSADGALAWSGSGAFIGRPGVPRRHLDHCATVLRRASQAQEALLGLADSCLRHIARTPEVLLRIHTIAASFTTADTLAPGWGRWFAAWTAALMAGEHWRRLTQLGRRDTALLLWQCSFDAHHAGLLLEAHPGPGRVLPGLDGGAEAQRYHASWTACCQRLHELGQRMNSAVMSHVGRRVKSFATT